MNEHPADFSWEKRLLRFRTVADMSESKCWQLAGDSVAYDIHAWLDLAEAELTAAQRRELKKL